MFASDVRVLRRACYRPHDPENMSPGHSRDMSLFGMIMDRVIVMQYILYLMKS